MNNDVFQNAPINLSTLIKRAIGSRILVCFLLAILIVFIISINDIVNSANQLENKISTQCKLLADFAVGQILSQNEAGIQPKLDFLNQKSSSAKFIWKSGEFGFSQELLEWHFPFSWTYYYSVNDLDGKRLGTFIVTGSLLYEQGLFSDLLTNIGLLLLLFIIIFIVLYPLGKKIPQKLFILPINNILALLRNGTSKNILEIDNSLIVPEEIYEIREKIFSLLKEVEEQSRLVAFGQIATQIAHDIRSPLAALSIETENLPAVPEKNRINIRNAIQHANDIANNLLAKYKQEKSIHDPHIIISSEPAAILLENVISEKRAQISSRKIEIKFEITNENYNIFINTDTTEFRRVLSNIINNSIESIGENGSITILLYENLEKAFIVIKDNGCGIPKDKLPLIFEEGASFGKKDGFGLGLHYAANKISSWHGDYSLTSELGTGTQFEIILPKKKVANWFAEEIVIEKNNTVVILDDDIYIHKIWDNCFSNITKHSNINLIHFYKSFDLIEFLNNNIKEKITFLLDYELIGSQEDGLSLAEKLNITSKTILVTNRYDDKNIREICNKFNIKILPKPFAQFISIDLSPALVPQH